MSESTANNKIAKEIVCSDTFLDLSLGARVLYYHLCVTAGDKGFLVNLYASARAVGATKADADALIDNGYVTQDNMNWYITHWDIHRGVNARNNYQYRKWRQSVLKRDGYKCAICGSKKNLEAHHIKPFAHFENYRLDINNGITLCRKCHKQVHKEQNGERLHIRKQNSFGK